MIRAIGALIAVGLLLIALALLDVTAPASCDEPDDQQVAGRVDDADKRYREILKDEPASRCARKGVRATERLLCREARELLDGGALEHAQKAYEARLAADPTSFCAVRGLRLTAERKRAEAAKTTADAG